MSELVDLQKAILRTRGDRGFVTDPVKLQVLFSEEIGEIASEIKRLWSKNYDDFNPDRLKRGDRRCARFTRGAGGRVRY